MEIFDPGYLNIYLWCSPRCMLIMGVGMEMWCSRLPVCEKWLCWSSLTIIPRSIKSDLNHKASQVPLAIALYSASALDLATSCFFTFPCIISNIRSRYPKINELPY